MDVGIEDKMKLCSHSAASPSPDPREPGVSKPAPRMELEPSGRGHLARGSNVQEEDGGARSAEEKEDDCDAAWGRAWEGRRPKRKWQQSEDGALVRSYILLPKNKIWGLQNYVCV